MNGLRKSLTSANARPAGLTLLEILATLAIVVALIGLAAFGLKSYERTVARRNAVGLLMGVLEEARVAALTKGTSSYVAFPLGEAPENYAYQTCAIFRDDYDAGQRTQIGSWRRLPKGVVFADVKESLLSTPPRNFRVPGRDEPVPCAVLEFDSTGRVALPLDVDLLRLILIEGYYTAAAGPVSTARTGEDEPVGEEIKINRSTGISNYVQPE